MICQTDPQPMKHISSFKTLTLALCLLTGYRSRAQSDEVLAAPRVTGLVVLGVQSDATTLLMTGNRRSTDVVNFDNAAPYKGDLILLRNAGFNVAYHTVNPLRYQVSVKRTGVASDGYQEALQGLLTSVSSIVMATSGGELSTGTALNWGTLSSPTAERLQNAWTLNFPQLAKFDDPAKAHDPKDELGLRDTQLRTELLKIRLLADTRDKVRTRQLALELEMKVKDAETYAGFDFLKNSVPLIQQLFEVDFTNKNADEAIQHVLEGVHLLDSSNAKLHAAMAKLSKWEANTQGTLAQKKEQATVNGDEKDLKTIDSIQPVSVEIADLLNQAFATSKGKLEALLSAREGVAKQIRDLANKLYKEKGVVDYSKNRVHRIYSSTLPKDSVARFSLSVKERWFEVDKAFNINQKDSLFFQRDFRLMKTHTFYPQVFPAVVFSDLSVPTYSLNNDTVTQGGPDEKPFKVAGMVNFNFKLGTTQEVPFLQIGASFLKSRPILYTGVGCRFTEWFGISFGAMFAWRPELTDLKVGDVVKDQATLDKDLSFQFMRPSFYLGLQFRPMSLTTKK